MAIKRREFLIASAAATLAAPAITRAQAANIKIGEINSYTAQPAFTAPYRNGINLAVEQINAAGGLLGRRVEVIFRDDAGRPEDAIRHANELLNNERVDVLAGTFLSNIGLAVSNVAREARRLFVASEPLTDAVVWGQGHRYTYRLRPSTYMQAAMLAEEAARLPAMRWAAVSPNYEYGQSAVRWFKELLTARKPGVTFVTEQFPALGRIDAGATVAAVAASNPDAIYNVTFGPDLTNFVRQGNSRGLFERKSVVSVLTGEPEYLDPLGEETPEGWIVTGYPWEQINTPIHTAFRDSYRTRFNDYPRLGSVVGFDTIESIAAAIRRANSVANDALLTAFSGLRFESRFGSVEYRAIDNQSTMGAYVGKTALRNRRGTMVDWRYADGKDYLPTDAVVRTLRPQG